MNEGEAETNYAYYCFHQINMLPSQFISLSTEDKAAIIAFIDIKVERDKKEQKKMKGKAKRKSKR